MHKALHKKIMCLHRLTHTQSTCAQKPHAHSAYMHTKAMRTQILRAHKSHAHSKGHAHKCRTCTQRPCAQMLRVLRFAATLPADFLSCSSYCSLFCFCAQASSKPQDCFHTYVHTYTCTYKSIHILTPIQAHEKEGSHQAAPPKAAGGEGCSQDHGVCL